MRITRTSPFNGKMYTMEIACTEGQLRRWQKGEHIQNVMPEIPAEHREFIMTGITPNQWNELFGDKE